MKQNLALCCVLCILLSAFVVPNVAAGGDVLLWPVDIHAKVFADTAPGTSGPLALSAARNEYESGQFGVFLADASGQAVVSVSALVHEDGKTTLSADAVRLRPVDTIPIGINTPGADPIVTRKAPCDMPDVLREANTFQLDKGKARSVWVTVFVPENARPGQYAGTVTVKVGERKTEMALRLTVFTFALPKDRHLWVTNWYSISNLAKVHKVPMWSEEFWPVLEKYFKNMADHRQNVLYTNWVPDGSFVKAVRKKDGGWDIDFSILERYLALAEKYGVCERIEFTHAGSLAGRKVQYRSAVCFDESAGKNVSVPVDQWLKPVLGALEAWLVKTNRIDRAMMHVADEPHPFDVPAWREASRRLHECAPKIKRIDAIEAIHFSDALEVWVPKLTHFDRWRDAFEARRGDGEMWYYICCHPTGFHYPNRFMDLPATRIRALHWINYSERLAGYLHWGLNFWPADPFGTPSAKYGPGDTHTIYPGPLDSIRWEIERESLEDYEYLVLLESLTANVKKDSKADLWWLDPKSRSMELARRIVPTLVTTELDPAKYAATRAELAREIESISNGPRLIVQTFPPDNGIVYNGPNLVELHGLTTPGAQVAIDGKQIPVDENGVFQYSDTGTKPHSLEIVATKDGHVTKTIRYFDVR